MSAPRSVRFIVAISSITLATAALAQTYDLSWYTIDGGGATFSTGGTFELGGTIGQVDAGPTPAMTGGAFELVGGFWPGAGGTCTCPGDLDGDGTRSGTDIQAFVNCYLAVGSACACADVNGNGMLDSGDVTTFVNGLVATTPCP